MAEAVGAVLEVYAELVLHRCLLLPIRRGWLDELGALRCT